MKIKINKRLKIVLIGLVIVTILYGSYRLYKEINRKEFAEERKTAYSYNNNSSIDYEVFLKPNQLYEESSLKEGNLFITEFVDYIEAGLNYEFAGERELDISGDYNVVAKVQGYLNDRDKITNIWERDFPIIEKERFRVKDSKIAINEKTKIELKGYNEFAKTIIESSKINCLTSLDIIMNVNLRGNMDKNIIEETISTSLVIPLNVSMFEIGGNPVINKSGEIEDIAKVPIPINKNKIIIMCVILGFLGIFLLSIIFLTQALPNKSPLEKMLKQIFKKHGDRMVALNTEPSMIASNVNQVNSIADLVKIADEIGKPIMYKYSLDYKEIRKFYVVHENEVYVFEIKEIPSREETEGHNKRMHNKTAKGNIS